MNKEKLKKDKIIKSVRKLRYPVRSYKASEIRKFLELDEKENKFGKSKYSVLDPLR